MLISLLWPTLFMGLVGGPHCLVMCAAPCALVASGGASDQAVSRWRWLSFHVGRLLGYSALGALAAWAMGEMAQLFVDGQNVVPARLQQQGFAFKYPTLEQALRDLV